MKHVYGRQRKHELKPLEDFDPRPVELCGKAKDHLAKFLDKVRGQGLGVSLLLDKESQCWSSHLHRFYQRQKYFERGLRSLRKVCV